MAVFLINNCKFQGCGLTFPTLADLIQHIEDTHIDNDPKLLEKQELQPPSALALSYILRLFTDAERKEQAEWSKKRVRAQSPAVSVRSSTPTGSEFDEDEMLSDGEDSDDSWTTQEEFTSGLLPSFKNNKESEGDKPFACPVIGCKKRYKNINGIKYHARHGHKKDVRIKKTFRCHCGKSYKTAQGLRNHSPAHPLSSDVVVLPGIATLSQRPSQLALPTSKPFSTNLTTSTPPMTPTSFSSGHSLTAAFAHPLIVPSHLNSASAFASAVASPKVMTTQTTFSIPATTPGSAQLISQPTTLVTTSEY